MISISKRLVVSKEVVFCKCKRMINKKGVVIFRNPKMVCLLLFFLSLSLQHKKSIMENVLSVPVSFTTGAVSEIKRLMTESGFDHIQKLRVDTRPRTAPPARSYEKTTAR